MNPQGHATDTGTDRRSSQRFPASVMLRYVTHEGEDQDQAMIGSAETVDVSASGLQLMTEKDIRVPSFLQVAIRITDRSHPVVLLAKTVWCRAKSNGRHLAGVKFLGNVDPAYVDYVESLEA
jgi:hypothetical protein